MSMNFSEFKKRLGVEPRSRDPEILDARKSSARFDAAAVEAAVFEDKLEAVIKVSPPDSLLGEIQSISGRSPGRYHWVPLAMAASILLAVGGAGFIWQSRPAWNSVEAYVADHFHHDGLSLLAKAGGTPSLQEINELLSPLGMQMGNGLARQVTLIKYCPTPSGRGIHMVVHTEQGAATILLMPDTRVDDGEMVFFDQQKARLVQLNHGSAAIIGDKPYSLDQIEQSLRVDLSDLALDV
jgi:hypothetical protein